MASLPMAIMPMVAMAEWQEMSESSHCTNGRGGAAYITNQSYTRLDGRP
jgi:hypothetical protein